MNAPAVSIQALTRRYPVLAIPAINALSADIPVGKLCGVVGPDGAGKTTLLRTLAGLLKPDEGVCLVHGYDTIRDAELVRTVIGYMPQRFGLYEELTVAQNLSLYGALQTVGNKKERIQELLHFAGLEKFTERRARDLSGGMKQKLGLICTLMRQPQVLLLDEPTAGLDPRSHDDFWVMIHQLQHSGVTILWSTSDLAKAEAFDLVLLLNTGNCLHFGTTDEVVRRVEGRVYHVFGLGSSNRSVLLQLAASPGVSDTTIQGDALRVVVEAEHRNPTLRSLGIDREEALQSIAPRFEDGFIDLLGGTRESFQLSYSISAEKRASTEPPIAARSLVKQFGAFTAVNNVTFSVKPGEIFGLLGPNGAGKSTTFKTLCGLIRPTSGEAFVNGKSLLTAPTDARRGIGYMAQSFSLYGNLTVEQNLRFFGGIYGVRKLGQRVDEVIHAFKLGAYVKMRPAELSLGLKQRLALACALVHEPPVLFLDEPTAGVDPLTRREFWQHINALTQHGATVLVSTHLMDEAEFCDRIGFIYEGKLKVVDTPDKLRHRAATPELLNPTLHDAFLHLCEA